MKMRVLFCGGGLSLFTPGKNISSGERWVFFLSFWGLSGESSDFPSAEKI